MSDPHNLLLIDSSIPDVDTFVNGLNSNSHGVLYSIEDSFESLKEKIAALHISNFDNVAFVFVDEHSPLKMFVSYNTFISFNETGIIENNTTAFLKEIVDTYNVKNLDFLACNLLSYSEWKSYFEYLMAQNSGLVVRASDDRSGNLEAGGDWVLESTYEDVTHLYFNDAIGQWNYLLDLGNHSAVLGIDGAVYTCGRNADGQLGRPGQIESFTNISGTLGTDISGVACGTNYTFVVKTNGTVFGCGLNTSGQLGLNDFVTRSIFTQVPDITDAIQVACGSAHSVILRNTGEVLGCGANTNGQIGSISDNSNMFVPITPIGTSESTLNISSIACGANHTMLLKNDGTIMATGFNANGQLGINSVTDSFGLVSVPDTDISGVSNIVCGQNHTLAVKIDGTVFGCGLNTSGQLGLNDFNNRLIFTQVPDITDAIQVACGSTHSVILRSSGEVFGCGGNSFGQIGSIFSNINNTINAVKIQSDGKILVGGAFTTPRNRLARFNPDGSLDLSFNVDVGGIVNAIAIDLSDNIVIGGSFLSVTGTNGTATDKIRIAKLNSNGELDTNFTTSVDSTVLAIAIDLSNNILIGGNFISVTDTNGTEPRDRIAKLNSNGAVDTNFTTSVSSTVNAITIDSGNNILIGGTFLSVTDTNGTEPRARIAKLNSNGEVDTNFTTSVSSTVNAITIDSGNNILIGGAFRSVTGTGGTARARDRIAKLNSNGALDSGLTTSVSSTVNAITIDLSDNILIGGAFLSVTGTGGTATERIRIAKLDPSGALVSGFTTSVNNTVNAIAIDLSNNILIGGNFISVRPSGSTFFAVTNRFAKLTPSGVNVCNPPFFVPIKTTTNESASDISSIAVGNNHTIVRRTNGTLMAAGFNGNGQLGIGTTADSSGLAAVPIISDVSSIACGLNHTIALTNNGTIFGSGSSTSGQLNTILATTTFGKTDTSDIVQVSCGVSHTLAVKNDGTVFGCGLNTSGQLGLNDFNNRLIFTQVPDIIDAIQVACGSTHSVILRSSGEVFGCGGNSFGEIGSIFSNINNNTINAVKIQSDGKILVGGAFTNPRNRLARFNPDGSLDLSFNVDVGGIVNAIAIDLSDNIVIGGSFLSVTGTNGSATTRNRIAKLNSNGELDTNFTTSVNSTVLAIAIDSGNNILIGGSFNGANSVGTATRDRIAKLNSNGAVDTNFTTSVSSTVNAITIDSGNNILIGGTFLSVTDTNGTATDKIRIAKLNSSGELDADFTTSVDNTVNAIAIDLSDNILIGGAFLSVTGTGGTATARDRIAKLNSNGALDSGLTTSVNNTINAIAIDLSNNILIGGIFLSVTGTNGTATDKIRIAKLNSNGELDTNFTTSVNSTVNAIAIDLSNNILIGGNFISVRPSGSTFFAVTNRFAKLTPSGVNVCNPPFFVPIKTTTNESASDISSIAVGNNHTIVRRTNGTLMATGYNAFGQLGIGTTADSFGLAAVITDINGIDISGVSNIACGQTHTIVLKNDGTVFGAGLNSSAQLGIGNNTTTINAFTQMPGINDAVAIACGFNHTIVLRRNESGEIQVWGCGLNSSNQLSAGSTGINTSLVHINIPTLVNPIAIACGNHTLVLCNNNGTSEIFCSGVNTDGELGIGSFTSPASGLGFIIKSILEPSIAPKYTASPILDISGTDFINLTTTGTVAWVPNMINKSLASSDVSNTSDTFDSLNLINKKILKLEPANTVFSDYISFDISGVDASYKVYFKSETDEEPVELTPTDTGYGAYYEVVDPTTIKIFTNHFTEVVIGEQQGGGGIGDPYIRTITGFEYKLPIMDGYVRYYQGHVNGKLLTINAKLRKMNNSELAETQLRGYFNHKAKATDAKENLNTILNDMELNFFEKIYMEYDGNSLVINIWNQRLRIEEYKGKIKTTCTKQNHIINKCSSNYQNVPSVANYQFHFGPAILHVSLYDCDLVRNAIYLQAPRMDQGNGIIVNVLSKYGMTIPSLDSKNPVLTKNTERIKETSEYFLDNNGYRVKKIITSY